MLASASPRRRRLLKLLGLPFRVVVTAVDESWPVGALPQDTAAALALAKAEAAERDAAGSLIIAADTVVDLDGSILGKPRDSAEAAEMLIALRGRWHRVWSGLSVINGQSGHRFVLTEVTDVLMRDYTREEIASYVATGDPMDKAAAYAIQHPGFRPVASVHGCYANVMGLPLCDLCSLLARFSVMPPVRPTEACPMYLGIICQQSAGSGQGRER